jgi:hypothetical protein
MNEPPRKPPVLRLEWWRFAVLAFLALSVIGVVALVKFRPGDWSPVVAMAILGTSLVSFFAYRWQRLRTDAASGRLTPEAFYGDPRAYIRGPVLPLVVWFAVTFVAIILIAVFGATRGG